ncbi:MAG: hypothetical protein IPO21_14045 [Bacteroidales bacterium]|nr:hypothetical protein [Bacteroidales bacterium]
MLLLSYNVQGEKLVLAANVPGQPDVYELPRHRIDFKLAKKFAKHFNAEFKIRDLLNSQTHWLYKTEGSEFEQLPNTTYKKYTSGTVYSLTIGYSF